MVDLIQTENKFFNKIIMAFSGLCKESAEMEKLAYEKYYAPLSIYGELTVDQEPTEGSAAICLCLLHLLPMTAALPPLLQCALFETRSLGSTALV